MEPVAGMSGFGIVYSVTFSIPYWERIPTNLKSTTSRHFTQWHINTSNYKVCHVKMIVTTYVISQNNETTKYSWRSQNL